MTTSINSKTSLLCFILLAVSGCSPSTQSEQEVVPPPLPQVTEKSRRPIVEPVEIVADIDLGEITQRKDEYPAGDREAVQALAKLVRDRKDATDFIVHYTNGSFVL